MTAVNRFFTSDKLFPFWNVSERDSKTPNFSNTDQIKESYLAKTCKWNLAVKDMSVLCKRYYTLHIIIWLKNVGIKYEICKLCAVIMILRFITLRIKSFIGVSQKCYINISMRTVYEKRMASISHLHWIYLTYLPINYIKYSQLMAFVNFWKFVILWDNIDKNSNNFVYDWHIAYIQFCVQFDTRLWVIQWYIYKRHCFYSFPVYTHKHSILEWSIMH